MTLKEIITGSDPEDEKLSSSLGLPSFRRWYCFGWRSPKILYKRLRNKYQPIRKIRFAAQRVRRGYDDPALWSVNYALATLTVAGCQYMRKAAHGYPAEFSDDWGDGGGWEKWEDILIKIEEGFQAWLDEDGWFHEKPEQETKFKEGMELFSHWFGALWD